MEQLFSGQKNTKQQGQEMIKTLKDNDENHHHHLMANDLNKTKKFNRQNVHCQKENEKERKEKDAATNENDEKQDFHR
ncbi:hypothetical protein DERF_008066 [Dermatophagoides farinae]|uniref:Uncharacterized protein n=1 Tax=Dermatophagoides farinae TaxID=6954 RepID=A0A922L542_DERFA|nr:hypothetical protein DERF_008066 [Dermatophagoides farinae]